MPSVVFVKPDSLVDGHPASSKLGLFEAMLENILGKLKSHPDLFKETAFIVTFDAGVIGTKPVHYPITVK